ncbi:uncharacterized protein K02A2.6-like [Telopea speciosissima]|uniref:uncharacterized protein K02A2.6-like n=1 Tax=Telopea speciosissima TaxID=54955 RepID=UPI001CC804F5|nr:uncharacterized protein K02A2.6-like [Telopea speciosissima]
MEKFFRDKVIYRFGLPKILVTDNGLQFNNSQFRAFCPQYDIELRTTSVAHPQANGQVEVTNCTLLAGIKRRLTEAKARWVDELPLCSACDLRKYKRKNALKAN